MSTAFEKDLPFTEVSIESVLLDAELFATCSKNSKSERQDCRPNCGPEFAKCFSAILKAVFTLQGHNDPR